MPTNSSGDRPAGSFNPFEDEASVSDETIRALFAIDDGGLSRMVIERMDVLNAETAELDRRVRQLRARRTVTRRAYPSLKSWLLYLLAVALVALVLSSLILHMSQRFGWGLYEWYNALLDTAEATLRANGPLHMLGEIVWLLIEIVVGVLVVIPLGILHMAEVILPDAESYLGFLEGAVVVAAAVVLLRLNPLAGEVTMREVKSRSWTAANERELNELEEKLRFKREQLRGLIDTISADTDN